MPVKNFNFGKLKSIFRSKLFYYLVSLVIVLTLMAILKKYSTNNNANTIIFARGNVIDSQSSATPKSLYLREAMFYEKLNNNEVKCNLCFRECIISEGKRGFCRTRENKNGTLYSIVYSRPSAIQIDPVEKEPQHHFLPGSYMLSIGTAGCNFKCLHCHNWHLSQRTIEELRSYYVTPEQIVSMTLERNIPNISFTYNDPIVFYEYVYDIYL